jgi:hypothetical protein
VKSAQFRANFLGDLIARKNGQELVEGEIETSHSTFAEFSQQLKDHVAWKRLGCRVEGVQDSIHKS